MDRWPSLIQINIFGFDDYFLGDADGDGVMDRLPPNSLAANYFNSSSSQSGINGSSEPS